MTSLAPRFRAHTLGSKTPTLALEVYVDFSCPFSTKLINRLFDEVLPWVEAENIPLQWTLVNLVQPWHPQSLSMHEASLAVEAIDPSKFIEFSRLLFSRRESFRDADLYHVSRAELNEKLADLAVEVGVDREKVLALISLDLAAGSNSGSKVTNDSKYFIKYCRLRSVHVSPSVLVNGYIDSSVSSGWSLEEWQAFIKKNL